MGAGGYRSKMRIAICKSLAWRHLGAPGTVAAVSPPEPPLLRDLLPELASELERCLRKEDEAQLADSVASLRIHSRCRCDETFCGSFYTGPKPEGGWGEGRRTFSLDADVGMMIVDVVDGVLRHVEIINRPEVRETLLSTPALNPSD